MFFMVLFIFVGGFSDLFSLYRSSSKYAYTSILFAYLSLFLYLCIINLKLFALWFYLYVSF